MSHREIIASSNICPNYLYHMMAVARVVFVSDYAERYTDIVSASDIATLQEHAELISFGGGNGGDLCDIVVSLPLIANLSSTSALAEYFRDVDKVAESHDIYPFMRKYKFYPEYMAPWYGIGHQEMVLMVRYREEIRRLGDVLTRNFATYDMNVWPVEKMFLDPVAQRLNEHFSGKGIIKAWEQITGEEFARQNFCIELATAIKDGPNANSICYDRVVFYHQTPWDKLVHLASHEVGTHILFLILREFQSKPDCDFMVLYHAIESLAMYYNKQVLGVSHLAYDMDKYNGAEYISFFGALHARNPQIGPRELLKKGMEWVGK